MTQKELAARLGLSYQQVQKYEDGRNRISAGLLYKAGEVLGVPADTFFQGLESAAAAARLQRGTGPDNLLGDRQVLQLTRAFMKIENPVVRRCIVALAETVAGTSASKRAWT